MRRALKLVPPPHGVASVLYATYVLATSPRHPEIGSVLSERGGPCTLTLMITMCPRRGPQRLSSVTSAKIISNKFDTKYAQQKCDIEDDVISFSPNCVVCVGCF